MIARAADLLVVLLHPVVCLAVLVYWITNRRGFRGLQDSASAGRPPT